MPLYGNELSRDVNPFAAGLGPVVSLTKEGDFVARRRWRRSRLPASDRPSAENSWDSRAGAQGRPRAHYSVLKDGTLIGEVTSGQPSPTLGYPVAMAYVDVEHSEPGTIVDVELRGKTEPFEVVALPFYKRQQ